MSGVWGFGTYVLALVWEISGRRDGYGDEIVLSRSSSMQLRFLSCTGRDTVKETQPQEKGPAENMDALTSGEGLDKSHQKAVFT